MSNTRNNYKKANFFWTIRYHISTFWSGYPREMSLYAKSLFSKKSETPRTKFVIFSTGRSGSTLLLTLLNSNNDLFCDGEILKHRFLFPFQVVDIHARIPQKSIYGFKLMTHHLKDVQPEAVKDAQAFLQKLVDDGYKIIYLERSNRLNQSLSMMYAILRNNWHKKKGTNASPQRMHIDMQDLMRWLDGFDELNKYEKTLLKSVPHIHLVYERDLEKHENHKNTIREVCDFLEIPLVQPNTNLRKITPKEYEHFIENVNELKQYISTTPYAIYLENQGGLPRSDNELNINTYGEARSYTPESERESY